MTADSLAVDAIPWPGPWVRNGRCRTAPWEIFFPDPGDDLEPARAICARCPVTAECREYAIPISELHGVWGGMSEHERRRARRALMHADQAGCAEAGELTQHQAAPGSLNAVLTELTRLPGRWAIVGHFQAAGSASTTASLLRTGKRRAPAGGRWDFRGRRSLDGGSDLWARFTPAGK